MFQEILTDTWSQLNLVTKAEKIDFTTIELKEKQRLDHLAGVVYNDSSYWWVIASASGIGWGLQVPAGTVIRIPTSLENVMSVL
jgi:hypothetical protein